MSVPTHCRLIRVRSSRSVNVCGLCYGSFLLLFCRSLAGCLSETSEARENWSLKLEMVAANRGNRHKWHIGGLNYIESITTGQPPQFLESEI